MLRQVAQGVLVSESEFMRTNTVVVQGNSGVLLIDPGIVEDELVALANDLRELGQPVVAGFATHPHWDHLLWHPELGPAPRYGTARCAATARDRLSDPGARARVATLMTPDIVGRVPLELLGQLTGLAAGATELSWDGPTVRIIEHQAHASGHAALLIEDRGVLVAGDLLSDVLIPMLDLMGSADPVADYLAALRLVEDAAGDAEVVIPGHGSVGGAGQLADRIARDRAYLHAVRDGREPGDPRLGPETYGGDWLPDVHERQVRHLAERRDGA